MRCSCQNCGTYMVQSEGIELGCVCPQCGTRCKMCLGTNSVVPRDQLRKVAVTFLARAMNEEALHHDDDESDPYRD